MTAAALEPTGADVRCAGVVHVYNVLGTDVAALRGVDLEVDAGERVALLGPSGSGKSTLLSVVAGLRQPSAGAVFVNGEDIARLPETRLRGYRASTVGLMLQGAASTLLPYATPGECVAFATGSAGEDPVLAAAGLARETRPVERLGRAQRQTTALAVALARRPGLLLADEPTSQLGDRARDELLDLLVDTAARAGTTVLVVTHDEEVAGRMQRMIRMRDGRVGAEGLRHEQYAVIGADGSVQLPEALTARWPPGSRVRVEQIGDEIRLSHRAGGPPP